MAVINVICPKCSGKEVVCNGKSLVGEQRYYCKSEACRKTFQLTHRYAACKPGIKEQISAMAMNGSGIRDTARVLSVNMNTVMSTLKKKSAI
jgi:transposase-like protein